MMMMVMKGAHPRSHHRHWSPVSPVTLSSLGSASQAPSPRHPGLVSCKIGPQQLQWFGGCVTHESAVDLVVVGTLRQGTVTAGLAA